MAQPALEIAHAEIASVVKPKNSQLCVWDFTIAKKYGDPIKWMRKYCKKWCYQLEEGKKGYQHYQCRVSLKVKQRKTELLKWLPTGWHLSPTSTANRDNQFYVMKEEGRLEGPWTDKDSIKTRELIAMEEAGLYPWQESATELIKEYNPDQIDILIAPAGMNGKTMWGIYCYYYKYGFPLPPYNDMKELSQAAWGAATEYDAQNFIIDMPRGMKKDKLWSFFSGIEMIKSGMIFDTRYNFKVCQLEQRPNIWVFTNDVPDFSLITKNRWRIWTIVDRKLQRMTISEAIEMSEMVKAAKKGKKKKFAARKRARKD